MITRLGIAASRGGGANLGAHLGGSTSDLARQMAAALGQTLIFDLHGRGAGRFQFADRALDIHRLAKAGVGIDNHRDTDAAGEIRSVRDQFGEREQADIGQRHRPGRKRRAGEIDGIVPGLLDQPTDQRVERAGNLNGRAGYRLAEHLTRRSIGHGEIPRSKRRFDWLC